MDVMNWADASEIKELHCGAKPVTVQCWNMNCGIEYGPCHGAFIE